MTTNIKSPWKRFGSLLAIGALSLGLLGIPGERIQAESAAAPFVKGTVLSGNNFISVAQEDTRELFVNPATGAFHMTDSALGQTLYSYPQEKPDETTSGYNQFGMNSAFIIQYINDKKVTAETNAVVASIRKNGLIVNSTENGAIFTYQMPELGITIPVACVLCKGGLEVSILVKEIREEKEFKLLECALMPYLGSAGPQDTGYLLVPDGSGALLEFSPDSPRINAFSYKKPVYDRDPMNSAFSVNNDSEDILLPVFAVKTQQRAVLGIVTDGDALTSLEVFAKGSKSMHSAIHPVMTYRGTYARTLFDSSWEKKKAVILAPSAAAIEIYTVRYTMSGPTDYAGLAAQTAAWYQTQDPARAKTRDTVPALYVHLLGAVRKPNSVLGVPTKTVYTATSYTQAKNIVQTLFDGGVSHVQLVYQGMFAGGLYDKMPIKAIPEKKLGNKQELESLCQCLQSHDSGFFPAADLSAIYKSGNGISYQRDASRDFAGGYKEIFRYSPITFAPQEEGLSYTVLTAAKLPSVYERFTTALLGQKMTAFADMGTGELASNNHRAFFGESCFVDREGARRLQQEAVAAAAARLDAYLAKSPAAYLLPYVTNISDVPSTSSRDNGFTREIPFYSLVASSFAQLAAVPFNFSDDQTLYLLRCIEYGLLPSAYVNGEDTKELWNTEANWLYAAHADTVSAALISLYRDHKEVLSIVGASPLTAHDRLQAGVYKSGYASGKTVIVNYNEIPVTVDGQTIPACSYRIGGAV